MADIISTELINEERYGFDKGIDENEDVLSQEGISKPYDTSKIQVDPKIMTVFQVMRKIQHNEINLQPDFQRNIVWDVVRQSRLIESILIRIPLPAFYLDAINDNDWLVVDGLQRLWTLHHFFNTKSIRLTNLEFLGNELHNKNFDEMPRSFQRQIEDTQLYLYVIRPDTPSEVKFTIFYRINTGGMVLSAQEIRHCLYQGKATVLLKKLADSKEFLSTTTSSINTKRMDDRECVLRYCAFHLTPYKEYRDPDFNLFLSNTMVAINRMADDDIAKVEESFFRSMSIAKAVFGRYAFRKMFERNGFRSVINKSLFEVWSVCLEKFDKDNVLRNKDKILDGFIYAMNTDEQYLESITQGTGGVTRVMQRFGTTMRIIQEALS